MARPPKNYARFPHFARALLELGNGDVQRAKRLGKSVRSLVRWRQHLAAGRISVPMDIVAKEATLSAALCRDLRVPDNPSPDLDSSCSIPHLE